MTASFCTLSRKLVHAFVGTGFALEGFFNKLTPLIISTVRRYYETRY